jgi:hypothetical protein
MRHYFIFFFVFFFVACSKDEPDIDEPGLLQINSARIGTLSLQPNEITEQAEVDKGLVFTFAEPLNQSTVPENITLFNSANEVIPLNFSFLDNDRMVSALPQNELDHNTQYQVELNTIQSTAENEFPGATYQFQTIEGSFELEEISINGQSLNVTERLVNLSLESQLMMAFTEPLNPDEDFSNLFLLRNKGTREELSFQLSEDQKTLTINTIEPLQGLAKYEFTISNNLKSQDDYRFDGFSKEFYTQLDSTYKFPEISDDALLTKIQEQTFKYFWDFAHPTSGLARERNSSGDVVTIGGSGFGVMAILVGIERNFITREQGVERLTTIVDFLTDADRFHGVWPHWMNGNTGATIPFSTEDNGADLVETAFMIEGLLTVRAYLSSANPDELALKNKITTLWEEVEWSWFTKDGENVLYWHWSPDYEWAMNLPIRGWNESLIVYVLAAASPTYPIEKEVYDEGWARNGGNANGQEYYGVTLPLGYDRGGPLFFAHYSFLGLDPRNLEDHYANYWEQNVAHTKINQLYCANNPLNYVGYGAEAWGLTASDNHEGYNAHSPTNDLGVITPTAAISSIPYTPEESMNAIHHFYYLLGDKLWGDYGFYDAYNNTEGWYANSYLAIDQGPIVSMIENYRSGLLWTHFMSDAEVQAGLTKLGFTY